MNEYWSVGLLNAMFVHLIKILLGTDCQLNISRDITGSMLFNSFISKEGE